jgi:hypothetical protein
MLIYPNGFKIIIIHTCKLLNLEVQLCDACVKSCDLTIIAWDQTQTLIWKWVNIFIFIWVCINLYKYENWIRGSLDNFWMGIVFEPLWYLIDFQIVDSHLKWQLLIFDLRNGLKIGWVNDTQPTLAGLFLLIREIHKVTQSSPRLWASFQPLTPLSVVSVK